jgi:hypothetical protein
MSFGNKSAVHNHLSTKHPLFSHPLMQDVVQGKQDLDQEKVVEPLHDESRFAERAPPEKSREN